jgi:hypothetical protein
VFTVTKVGPVMVPTTAGPAMTLQVWVTVALVLAVLVATVSTNGVLDVCTLRAPVV